MFYIFLKCRVITWARRRASMTSVTNAHASHQLIPPCNTVSKLNPCMWDIHPLRFLFNPAVCLKTPKGAVALGESKNSTHSSYPTVFPSAQHPSALNCSHGASRAHLVAQELRCLLPLSPTLSAHARPGSVDPGSELI